MGMQNHTDTLGNNWEVSYKIKYGLALWPDILLGLLQNMKSYIHTKTYMLLMFVVLVVYSFLTGNNPNILEIYPNWYSLRFLDLWFAVWHQSWEILSYYCFTDIFSVLFSLLVHYTFCSYPTVLGYSVSAFFHLFSLRFSFGNFC